MKIITMKNTPPYKNKCGKKEITFECEGCSCEIKFRMNYILPYKKISKLTRCPVCDRIWKVEYINGQLKPLITLGGKYDYLL